MVVRVREVWQSQLGELRVEPTAKRIRASLAGTPVLDTTRAVLVWEPRRVVPCFAVPEGDLAAELVKPERPGSGEADLSRFRARPVLDPSAPFEVHTTEGEPVAVRLGADTAQAFRVADPGLAGYVALNFADFDTWYEEDERILSHPRDPFHRIDALPSSRQVRLELDGDVLAESGRPHLLFESMLPTRYYLPREDVRVGLTPSATRTTCAYKGEATYFSPQVNGQLVPDLAWSYEDPRHDAANVRGLVCFFHERLDLTVDGQPQERVRTPWSTPDPDGRR